MTQTRCCWTRGTAGLELVWEMRQKVTFRRLLYNKTHIRCHGECLLHQIRFYLCHSTWWLETGSVFLPTLFQPLPQPFRSSPCSTQIHRACLHFQWEGKEEVSRLLIAFFTLFSRKKKKKKRQQPQPCSAETGLYGEALLKTDGGEQHHAVLGCAHTKANTVIAQGCFTHWVWLVSNKAPND